MVKYLISNLKYIKTQPLETRKILEVSLVVKGPEKKNQLWTKQCTRLSNRPPLRERDCVILILFVFDPRSHYIIEKKLYRVCLSDSPESHEVLLTSCNKKTKTETTTFIFFVVL